jgi:putative membrane protein
MRTVRSFEIIALAVPLALAACSKDSQSEPRVPEGETEYSTENRAAGSSMTPASRVDESQGQTTALGTMTPPDSSPQHQGAAPEATTPAPLNDAQIIAITDAANSAEVDAAKYALSHAKNARVRKFAQMMIDHHGKAKQDQAKLVSRLGMSPEESTKLRDLRTSAGDTDRTLKAAPDDMFDKVYIDIQVADHQMVLDALDRDFIPNVQNPELKQALQDFRPKVEQHLNQALEIQKALMSSPAPKSGSSSGSGSGSSGTQRGSKPSDSGGVDANKPAPGVPTGSQGGMR